MSETTPTTTTTEEKKVEETTPATSTTEEKKEDTKPTLFSFSNVPTSTNAFSPTTSTASTTESEEKTGSEEKAADYEAPIGSDNYTPALNLKEVEAKTGEEDEEVLYQCRAKLYRYKTDPKPMWDERGTGDIKFLKDPSTKKIRLVMRREKVFKVCLNHPIIPELKLNPNAGSDKSWVWNCPLDFSDDEFPQGKKEFFAIRFGTPESGNGQFLSSPSRQNHSRSNSSTSSSSTTGLNLISTTTTPPQSSQQSNTPTSSSTSDRINRRKQQSKSVSYSNFNILPELQEEYRYEQILDFCSVLKERLKQLSIQLELDLSELDHKDQEIDLLKNRVNKYNTEIREKEEENEGLNGKIRLIQAEQAADKDLINSLQSELQLIRSEWINPQEIDSWKEQINAVTVVLEQKELEFNELDADRKSLHSRIQLLQDQIEKERDLHQISRQEYENTSKQLKMEREQYNRELESMKKKIEKSKQKQLEAGEKIKKQEFDWEQQQRQIEKLRSQLNASEKESIELRHQNESLQSYLDDTRIINQNLSSSQNVMKAKLNHSETELQAAMSLINKKENANDEKMQLLITECQNSNEIIAKLTFARNDLERQLTEERLNHQISAVSLNNTNFTISERDLIRKVQEKDEEIQLLVKKIQRLQVDNNSLTTKTKKLEENFTENTNQLQITKKSLRNSRKELSKITHELLILSDDNYNESIGNISATSYSNNNNNNEIDDSFNNNNNNNNSFLKRKSLDFAELSRILNNSRGVGGAEHHYDDLVNGGGTTINSSNGGSDLNGSPSSPILSPIKSSGGSFTTPVNPLSRARYSTISGGISPMASPISKQQKNNNNNNTTVDQTEEMLERARSANIGYRLHIQFLGKEVKRLEKELDQQKDLMNGVIRRLSLDLEESKELNSRIRKTFLHRFSKEDDIIFLDYYTLTDKYHKFNNNSNTINLDSPLILSRDLSSSTTSSTSSLSPPTHQSLNITTELSSISSSLPSPSSTQYQNHNNHEVITTNNINSSSTTTNTNGSTPISPSPTLNSPQSRSSKLDNTQTNNKKEKDKTCNRCSKEFSFFRGNVC
eukprot:gene8505-10455_t